MLSLWNLNLVFFFFAVSILVCCWFDNVADVDSFGAEWDESLYPSLFFIHLCMLYRLGFREEEMLWCGLRIMLISKLLNCCSKLDPVWTKKLISTWVRTCSACCFIFKFLFFLPRRKLDVWSRTFLFDVVDGGIDVIGCLFVCLFVVKGHCALTYASYSQHISIAVLLIAAGAEVNMYTSQKTPDLCKSTLNNTLLLIRMEKRQSTDWQGKKTKQLWERPWMNMPTRELLEIAYLLYFLSLSLFFTISLSSLFMKFGMQQTKESYLFHLLLQFLVYIYIYAYIHIYTYLGGVYRWDFSWRREFVELFS